MRLSETVGGGIYEEFRSGKGPAHSNVPPSENEQRRDHQGKEKNNAEGELWDPSGRRYAEARLGAHMRDGTHVMPTGEDLICSRL